MKYELMVSFILSDQSIALCCKFFEKLQWTQLYRSRCWMHVSAICL